ncbi:uncharacterized protein J4E88_009492 [Alternaria novae-zelandiae]|uniref:uncharacterized protein n=1 Tax=Alternaria novae-zelandiae TaxID=430562 RepID=UPI0020C2564E|nr:uncharacterized protein J4E88_009492 [Alternaria novae-zelandiae]KAI4671094.1 hypothetical protein J4E88_009492 [Alternaria novae-zelandiae]
MSLLVVPKRILLLVKSVNAAAKLGTRALIGKAVVIRTTASVATTPSFNVIRQSHTVFLEGAGRASDVEIAGSFSHFWNACLRMFIGSVNRLGPAIFGLEINELNQTSRVKNLALLELCTLAKDLPQLQAVAGSFDDALSAEYATINKAIWGIDNNLMFLNAQDATSTKDVSGTSYSLETTAAVMKDAADHTNTWRAISIPSSVRRAKPDYYMISSAAY